MLINALRKLSRLLLGILAKGQALSRNTLWDLFSLNSVCAYVCVCALFATSLGILSLHGVVAKEGSSRLALSAHPKISR
jgi:hypothetical protein